MLTLVTNILVNILRIFKHNQRPEDTGTQCVTESNTAVPLLQLENASFADN